MAALEMLNILERFSPAKSGIRGAYRRLGGAGDSGGTQSWRLCCESGKAVNLALGLA